MVMTPKNKLIKKALKAEGIKLLTKKQLQKVESGNWIDCDTLHQSLLHAGYKVTYENIWEDIAGFIAIFTLDGERLGIVENCGDGHMVRGWHKEMLITKRGKTK
jgi:hypothetical protein